LKAAGTGFRVLAADGNMILLLLVFLIRARAIDGRQRQRDQRSSGGDQSVKSKKG
jgi:hypothetical protein